MSESATTWQEIHKAKPWGRWPPESIVSYFCRRWAPTERRTVRVLDLGCGAGACTRFLVDEGFSVTAIDCSEEALTRMRYNLQRWDLPKVEAVCADITKPLSFSDGSFDVVLDNLCLSHIDGHNRVSVTKEIHRILVPHGTFLTRMFLFDSKRIDGVGPVHYADFESMRDEWTGLFRMGEYADEQHNGIHLMKVELFK
jgi:SAM-dependent methyltransferase